MKHLKRWIRCGLMASIGATGASGQARLPASVKLNTHCETNTVRGGITPSRLDMPCQTVRNLVRAAFARFGENGITPHQLEVIGGPAWVDSDRYDVSVVTDSPMRPPELLHALQGVLQERFQLKVRTESREKPVYELTIAGTGAKLHSSSPGSCQVMSMGDMAKGGGSNTSPRSGELTRRCGSGSRRGDGTKWVVEATGITMNEFAARMLSGYLDREVADATGLSGRFDIHLTYAHESGNAAPVRVNGN